MIAFHVNYASHNNNNHCLIRTYQTINYPHNNDNPFNVIRATARQRGTTKKRKTYNENNIILEQLSTDTSKSV